MSYIPYFETFNFNAVDTLYSGVSSLPFGNYSSIPLFGFAGNSYIPSFNWTNNIWNNSYYFAPGFSSSSNSSSLDAPKSLAKSSALPASNSYDFGSVTSSYRSNTVAAGNSFQLASSKPETSVFTERTVTPRGGGKYRRPSFKTTEAARLWDGFSAKASAFNPKTDLGPEFLAKVKKIAGEIGCEYRDLLSLMQVESGLNPYIPNLAGYGAYGLIQFQPATLRGLGYQPEDLLRMSPVEQLDIVKKHLVSAKKSRGLNGKLNAGQLYGLVLAPGYVNNSYFYSRGSNGYSANAQLDTKYGNNNGKIEKSDLAACISANRVNENIFVA